MSAPRRLVLLRHAKAEQLGGPDRVRPLALVGRRQAGSVGAQLRAEGLVPDHVLCSSALRTRQTWELVRGGLGPISRSINVEVRDEVYDAGVPELLALLREVPATAATVLVVGHEPTMSAAAARLAGPGSSPQVLDRVSRGVPTASWTLLEPEGDWLSLGPGAARLAGLRVPA
ncbi:MAG: histidine phosphatase family protein [Actinobacteria bacterium]|nr:histidine phosphatase family protein [Actinomycetota bacterium]MCG2801403.1 histidine phosphatase family protein [Cellulomonas sp.]